MSKPKSKRGEVRSDFIPSGGYGGIDPGASGGLAYVCGDFVKAWKMPDTEADIWEVVKLLSQHSKLIVLEKVSSMPAQGVASTFKFGMSYGGLRMALAAAGARREFVTPAKWQGDLKCRTKGNKNITKTKAQELWPNLRITHAIADALLLAEYGRVFYN